MIEDRWMKTRKDEETGKESQVRTELWGKGRRYRARVRTAERKERSKCFHHRKDAVSWEREQLHAMENGTWIDPAAGNVTFGEFSQVWLEGKVDIKASTRAGYESMVRLAVASLGERAINKVSHVEVRDWVRNLLAEGYSPSHVRQILGVVRGVLALAVRDGRIARNVCEGLRVPRVAERRRVYLGYAEVERLAAEIGRWKIVGNASFDAGLLEGVSVLRGGDGAPVHVKIKGREGYLGLREWGMETEGAARRLEQLSLLVRLLAYTGLRFGEAAGLRVEDIDFARGRINVRSNVVEVSGRLVEGTPKTHRSRVVPLPLVLVDELAQWCLVGGVGREFGGGGVGGGAGGFGGFGGAVGAYRAGSEWLFSTSRGTPLRASNIRLDFALAATVIGRPELHIHDLRHTAASLAVASGANVKAVQQMLGHKSAAMTLDVYADLFDEDLDRLAGAMAEAWWEWKAGSGGGYGLGSGGYGASPGGGVEAGGDFAGGVDPARLQQGMGDGAGRANGGAGAVGAGEVAAGKGATGGRLAGGGRARGAGGGKRIVPVLSTRGGALVAGTLVDGKLAGTRKRRKSKRGGARGARTNTGSGIVVQRQGRWEGKVEGGLAPGGGGEAAVAPVPVLLDPSALVSPEVAERAGIAKRAGRAKARQVRRKSESGGKK